MNWRGVENGLRPKNEENVRKEPQKGVKTRCEAGILHEAWNFVMKAPPKIDLRQQTRFIWSEFKNKKENDRE